MIKGTSIFPLYIFHTLIVIFQALPFQTCPSVFALIIKIYIQLNYNDCGYLSIKFQISVAQIKTRMNFITSKALRSPPWLGWPSWNICVTNDHGYVPLVVNTSRSFPHSWLVTGFVTKLTRRMPLVEQELPTLPEHLSSPPVFSGARVTRSLV